MFKTNFFKPVAGKGAGRHVFNRALPTFMLALLPVLGGSYSATADTLDEVQADFASRIQRAQETLAASERRIADERSRLSQSLNQEEREIRRLRDETAAARRLADEATLSLQQLEERLDSWDEQSRFQQNLLGRFKQQVSNQAWPADIAMADRIAWLNDYLRQQQVELYPQWVEQQLVMPSGDLQIADVLNLGPVEWFWQAQSQQAGFVSNDNDRAEVSLVFNAAQSEQVRQLHDNQEGLAVFDPTLSRALRLAQEEETLAQHIIKGGVWVIPILVFGLFALIISLLKALQIWRLPEVEPLLAERLMKLDKIPDANERTKAQAGIVDQAKGLQQKLLQIIQQTSPGQIRDDRLFSALMDGKHHLEYWLGAIAVTASVAPLLGLLGTVSGMIEAFRMMTLFGAGDPAAVSGGISAALITTELGLIVAIPALVLHALLSRWVKSYYGQLEGCAITLSQLQLPQSADSIDPAMAGVTA